MCLGENSSHITLGMDALIDYGAVAKRLRHRSREKIVPSSNPRWDISVEVTSQC